MSCAMTKYKAMQDEMISIKRFKRHIHSGQPVFQPRQIKLKFVVDKLFIITYYHYFVSQDIFLARDCGSHHITASSVKLSASKFVSTDEAMRLVSQRDNSYILNGGNTILKPIQNTLMWQSHPLEPRLWVKAA